VPISETPDALVTQLLRQAMREASATDYAEACGELARLNNLEIDLARRRTLLKQINRSAPAWASALENRHPEHDKPQPPGDPDTAWEWRQLYDELERRASVSLDELQQRIEDLGGQLLEVTAQLVEKQTWMNQIRQVTSEQRQALGHYALYRDRITKSRKGVLDQHFIQAARKEMELAKQAVPVWIMPLAEAAETFDPSNTRFDVVIIDEASQCDPTGMFALYLAKQAVVVGDKEQVTPTVFQDRTEVLKLINNYLSGIPGRLAYDGETSVYELAEPSFGGVIALTEHFRCAPDIIAFSNELSYKGEIKPLREASSIPLNPHVVHFRVESGRDRGDNVNEVEAETVAALLCAAIEQPEFAKNDHGKPTTFGVVSMVANNQALKIDGILRQRLEPAEYRRRQVLCGDSAQFQGDERDVMFLSLVDSPPSEPPLAMKQEGGKKVFKKRFNVAASRARNQMWIVHSLNHETDLQPGDYRRRLIEHALDPNAWERELLKRMERTESIFEERVLRRLVESHYNVLPQFHVGAYRIDLVITGNGRRLAVECDGEQYHGPEKLQEDGERQAILERLGWKFVRIRGSIFFRDEDRALEPMFGRLAELNIPPELEFTEAKPSAKSEIVERVIRRAQEMQACWHSNEETAGKSLFRLLKASNGER
jgi:very-short-patch-repair endonuclease